MRADALYRGRTLSVSGVIGSIQKDVMGDPEIVLSVAGSSDVLASFGKSDAGGLMDLRQGQTIVLTCRGSGESLTFPTLDCAGGGLHGEGE